jgi:hypothetical protein
VCLLASLTAVNLLRAQISHGFRIAGDVTVTQNTIDWAKVNSPFTALPATIDGGSTGWFSGLDLDATSIAIAALSRSTEPVGSDFGSGAFLNFDADPTMAPLGIDYIVDVIFPVSGCLASLPAVGQTAVAPVVALRRTPVLPVTLDNSPFIFVDNAGTAGTPPIQTTSTCVLTGTTSGGGTREGNFSTASGEPVRTVSDSPASASIPGAFAAAMIVTAKVEPDGEYMLGSGLGLILLSLGSRRLFGKRQAK